MGLTRKQYKRQRKSRNQQKRLKKRKQQKRKTKKRGRRVRKGGIGKHEQNEPYSLNFDDDVFLRQQTNDFIATIYQAIEHRKARRENRSEMVKDIAALNMNHNTETITKLERIMHNIEINRFSYKEMMDMLVIYPHFRYYFIDKNGTKWIDGNN